MFELFSSIHWWGWLIIATTIVICYVVSSIKTISEHEQGYVIFLGKIKRPLESGPHLVFWPSRIRRAPKNAIKVDFGTLDQSGDLERANKSETSDTWYVMKEPIRINWGDITSSTSTDLTEIERKKYENDPMAKRLTTDPHLYFIFKVIDLKSLIEEAEDLGPAMERIKDTCITVLQEEAGKTFLAKAIKEVGLLSEKIRKEVEWLVGDPGAPKRRGKRNPSWGVDILEVRIKDLGTSHAVNKAISARSAKVAEAAGDATATVLKSASEKIKLTQEGEGRAAAIKAEGIGKASAIEAEGAATASAIAARAEAVSKPGGELIARLDALQTGLKHGKTVILPADLSLLTTATSVKAVLDTIGKEKE